MLMTNKKYQFYLGLFSSTGFVTTVTVALPDQSTHRSHQSMW